MPGLDARRGGMFVSLDAPESTGTFPASINDEGTITGNYGVSNPRICPLARRNDYFV
jgi:hypothetical protein